MNVIALLYVHSYRDPGHGKHTGREVMERRIHPNRQATCFPSLEGGGQNGIDQLVACDRDSDIAGRYRPPGRCHRQPPPRVSGDTN